MIADNLWISFLRVYVSNAQTLSNIGKTSYCMSLSGVLSTI